LNTNLIGFTTPEYNIKLETNTKENYLQIYTPENRKTIAIEPMTGICDSFNNKKGLQILHSNEEHEVKWNLTFSENKN
jgi:aldose 1-epimerase